MLRAYCRHADKTLEVLDGAGFRDFDWRPTPGEPLEAIAPEQSFVWIDITEPSEADYQLLSERLGLHPLVLEDLQTREERPKLHDYDEYFYLTFHVPLLTDWKGWKPGGAPTQRPGIYISEVDCLVGADYVVTLHGVPLEAFEELAQRFERRPALMHTGPPLLLYELLDVALDSYFPLLDCLDDYLDALENQLLSERREGFMGDLLSLRRTLLQMRHVAGPTRDVVNKLLHYDAEKGDTHFAYYQDLYDHAARIVDTTDTFRELLSDALDAHLAAESNRMNEVMKTLTSASIILLIPTLIAGIYGMNFENMPELHTRNGYFITLGLMSTTIVGLFAYFKNKQWL